MTETAEFSSCALSNEHTPPKGEKDESVSSSFDVDAIKAIDDGQVKKDADKEKDVGGFIRRQGPSFIFRRVINQRKFAVGPKNDDDDDADTDDSWDYSKLSEAEKALKVAQIKKEVEEIEKQRVESIAKLAEVCLPIKSENVF